MNKELQDLLQGENDKIRELRNEIEKTQNQIEGVRREINGLTSKLSFYNKPCIDFKNVNHFLCYFLHTYIS